MKRKIKLTTIKDVQNFVNLANKYPDLTLRHGKYCVMASSLLGVLSLDLEKPIELHFNEKFQKLIDVSFKKWIIE